jgi:hypothetical protein
VNPAGNVLNDTLNWTMISGLYTAAGGEQYITIGSFIPDNALTIINRGGTYPFTSYAIEDVWVIDNSILTGAHEVSQDFDFNIFPNPGSDLFEMRFVLSGRENISMKLFDANGRLVKSTGEKNFNAGRHQIKCDTRDERGNRLRAGFYVLQMNAGEQTLRRKLIIQ